MYSLLFRVEFTQTHHMRRDLLKDRGAILCGNTFQVTQGCDDLDQIDALLFKFSIFHSMFACPIGMLFNGLRGQRFKSVEFKVNLSYRLRHRMPRPVYWQIDQWGERHCSRAPAAAIKLLSVGWYEAYRAAHHLTWLISVCDRA